MGDIDLGRAFAAHEQLDADQERSRPQSGR